MWPEAHSMADGAAMVNDDGSPAKAEEALEEARATVRAQHQALRRARGRQAQCDESS